MYSGRCVQQATPHLLQSITMCAACHASSPPVDSLAVLSMYLGRCAQHATPHLLQSMSSQYSSCTWGGVHSMPHLISSSRCPRSTHHVLGAVCAACHTSSPPVDVLEVPSMYSGLGVQQATPHLLQSIASQYSMCTRGGVCSMPCLISSSQWPRSTQHVLGAVCAAGHASSPPVNSRVCSMPHLISSSR